LSVWQVVHAFGTFSFSVSDGGMNRKVWLHHHVADLLRDLRHVTRDALVAG
jgi:hypothetical protein